MLQPRRKVATMGIILPPQSPSGMFSLHLPVQVLQLHQAGSAAVIRLPLAFLRYGQVMSTLSSCRSQAVATA
jgi:hypothetical protein